MLLRWPLFFLTLASLLASVAAFAERPTRRVVHALIVADTNARGIGASTGRDRDHVREALRLAVPRDQLKVTELTGNDVTLEGIDKWFQDWKGAIGVDTIFVYVASHGAWEMGRGHYLTLSNGDRLYRTHLRQALLFQRAAKSVLLTDTCGDRLELPRVHVVYRAPENPDYSLLGRLLLDGDGFTDVNSAEEKQEAWGNDDFGGWFTYHFLAALRANPRGNLSFDQVVDTAAAGLRAWLPKEKTQEPAKFHSHRMREYHQSILALKNFDSERTVRVRVEVTEGEDIRSPLYRREFTLAPHAHVSTGLIGTRADIWLLNAKNEWDLKETIALRPPAWKAYRATAIQTVTSYFAAQAPAPRPFPGR